MQSAEARSASFASRESTGACRPSERCECVHHVIRILCVVKSDGVLATGSRGRVPCSVRVFGRTAGAYSMGRGAAEGRVRYNVQGRAWRVACGPCEQRDTSVCVTVS